MDKANDTELWNYACDNDYVIVTKDADFSDKSLIHGYPPKYYLKQNRYKNEKKIC